MAEKVKVTRPFEYGGEKHEKDSMVDLPDSVAEEVVDKGYGEYADEAEEEVPSFDEPEESGELEEPGEVVEKAPARGGGIDVDEYTKSGGWVTPDDVSEGDELEITGPGRMDDRFETEYLVIPVRYQGAELELRLGKRNTKRVADEFGSNTGDWIGKKIKVAAIEDYPGLGTKGLILRPVGE